MKKIFFFLIFMCLAAQTGLAQDEAAEGEEGTSEHHLAMGFGMGSARNKIVEKAYDSYLEKKVGTQDVFSLKYQYLLDRDVDFTSGFSAGYFYSRSKESRSYDFGTMGIAFTMRGLSAGWGVRHRVLLDNLFFIGSGELGLVQEDMTITTPAGDVTYKDFEKRKTFDDFFFKLSVGSRWDFWRTLGLRVDVDMVHVFSGDRLLSLSLGLGYGL